MNMADMVQDNMTRQLGGSTRWQGMMPQSQGLNFGAMPPSMPAEMQGPNFGATPSPDVVEAANVTLQQSMPKQAPQTAPEAVNGQPAQDTQAPSPYAPTTDAGKWLAGEIAAGRMSEDGRFLSGKYKGKMWYGDGTVAYRNTLNPDQKKWTAKERQQLEERRLAEIRRELGMVKRGVGEEMNSDRVKKFNEELGKQDADYHASLTKELPSLREAINTQNAYDALVNEGLRTGWGQGVLDKFGKFFNALGIKDSSWLGANKPETADAFNQLVEKNVFNVLLEQKGPQTDTDAIRARQTWAQISNSPGANKWITQYTKNRLERQMEMNNFILDEMERNGGNARKAMAAWDKEAEGKPSIVPKADESLWAKEEKEPVRPRTPNAPGFNTQNKPEGKSGGTGRYSGLSDDDLRRKAQEMGLM